MKTVGVLEYFENIKYNWEKDKDNLEHILGLTKTRPKKNPPEGYVPSAGHEQTYLIKAIAENMNVKKFFEIGTGRGTACYAVSLLSNIDEIVTVDIVSHYQKRMKLSTQSPWLYLILTCMI